MTLTWSKVPYTFNLDTPTYDIYWNTASSVSKNDNKIENVISPHVVEGLVEGTVYYFVITSKAVNLQSEISFEVTATAPLPALSTILLQPVNVSIASDMSIQYRATGKYTDGSTIDLTSSVIWGSADTRFATIDNTTNKGLATADQIGITTISAVDPISNIEGKTSIRTQFNHNTLGDPVPDCLTSDCHTQSPDHPKNSTVLCSACHSTIEEPYKWYPLLIDHLTLSVEQTCFSCHSGTVITKKSINHLPTEDACEMCHQFSNGWASATINHSTISGNCISCHNSTIVQGKSATHIQTSDVCDACHSVFPSSWSVFPSAVDHLEVLGTCIDCHIGTITVARANNHIPTSDICDACHNTNAWLPVTTTNHNETIGTCFTCHNGTLANGKTATHIRSLDVCEKCHNPFSISWSPLANSAIDHTQVLGTCSDCHNGVTAETKSKTHISSSNVCNDCHITLNWTTMKTPL